MNASSKLTKREDELLELLLQGMSNKQIALALSITESTVEYHLSNIYAKFEVSSSKELFALLGKSRGDFTANLGESTVEAPVEIAHNQEQNLLQQPVASSTIIHWKARHSIIIVIGLAMILAILLLRPDNWNGYSRECEAPSEATMGQTLTRPNASGGKVLGQFGTTAEFPWPSNEGQVIYRDIPTPHLDQVYLKLLYSKDSPASVAIQVFINNETTPRNEVKLVDQHSWEQFAWSEPVKLGEIKPGVHTIKLYTVGQPYGVADLDRFILTNTLP